MSTRVDIEELQTTKTEKLLAGVLVVFLMIGGVWTYQKIDDWVKPDQPIAFEPASTPAIERRDRAERELEGARGGESRALQQLELRREAYRTALDADRPAADLERRYVAADRAYLRAQERHAAARREVAAARPAAEADERRSFERAESEHRRQERNTFFARLAFVLAGIVLAYLLLWHLHGRQSRYLALAFAGVVTATLLALVLAGDYITDYFDPFDLGPLFLALVGSAVTIVTFYALQRYIARRLPARRVRRSQCPFCGYPSRGNAHCEGCGRDLVAECNRCAADRRVGTLHCQACGVM
ncbi:MAG: hypothetical protein M3P42_06915 [Actinomycetota bacterium]|nr:hypothetical protein [Actinomycetota bacterium]